MAAIGMPPHILALFQSRPPLQQLPALPTKRPKPYFGIADYVQKFEDEKPTPPLPFETPRERIARRKKEKLLAHLRKQRELISKYSPKKDIKVGGDPFCTLFVSKMSYDTTEKKLRREFEHYGRIKVLRIIYDKENKHRGYGFIEYENDRDMKEAYKKADGTKIDGRRVLVDVERARTVPGWLPRRLGGGRGPPRGAGGKNQQDVNTLLAELQMEKDRGRKDERRHRDRERDRDRDRDRDRERDRDRDRDRERDRDRNRERRRSRSRSRSRERREKRRENHETNGNHERRR